MKFYDIWDGKVEFGTELWFVMGALHPKDPNYVEVTVKRHRQHCKLGHVKADAAEWLSPLLTRPFTITG